MVKKAHKSSKKVFYDIDDFVFEYESIAELGVLNSEYKNARAFCDNIKNVMRQCDAYITSTNALAKEIKKSMNSDKVYINRNVASAEMAVVSASEKEHAMKNPEKVILGYFSGTKTHDKDFREIKDVLLEIMKTHDNVWLKVGGQITLPKEFSACSDRIETFDFVSWKKLLYIPACYTIGLLLVPGLLSFAKLLEILHWDWLLKTLRLLGKCSLEIYLLNVIVTVESDVLIPLFDFDSRHIAYYCIVYLLNIVLGIWLHKGIEKGKEKLSKWHLGRTSKN